MRHIMLAVATALAVGAANTVHAHSEQSSIGVFQTASSVSTPEIADTTTTSSGTAAASLTALLADWNRAGFVPPSKPSQFRVFGRSGYATSGPEYNTMVSLIRAAKNDIREGRDGDAATKIARARRLLDASKPEQR